MAQEDLDDMVVVKTDDPKTAAEQLNGFGESPNDVENLEAAIAANVQHAGFINYDVALDKYAARPDMEDLAHKNARNMPDDFADAAFMRARNADSLDHGGSGSAV